MRNLQTIEGIVLSLVSFMQIKNSNITETIDDSLEKARAGYYTHYFLHKNEGLLKHCRMFDRM